MAAPSDPDAPPDAPSRTGKRPARPPTEAALRRGFLLWGQRAFALASLVLVAQLVVVARSVVGALLAVVLLCVFGGALALVAAPISGLLRRRLRLPVTAAALTSLAILVGAVIGIGVLVVGPLIGQSRDIAADLPRLEQPLVSIETWFAMHGISVGFVDQSTLVHQLVPDSGVGGFVLQALTGTFTVMVNIVIVIVVAFWLLRDAGTIRRGFLSMLPATAGGHATFVIDAVVLVVGGYLRAQLLLAVLIGVLAGGGCALLGVPFPLVIGVATGVFELVPLVGAFVGAGVGALFALTVSPALTVETLGLFLGIHIFEGYIVAPKVQAKFVRIHPLIAFLALIAGVEVGGFVGALLAVPVASIIAVLLRAFVGDWKANRPDLFARDQPPLNAELAGRRRKLLREYRTAGGGNPLRAVGRRLFR
jgi:predicted PurR-regulated permease PerM